MHFEILIEDQSGKVLLDAVVPRIIGEEDTFVVHAYRGIGRIPRGMTIKMEVGTRLLLHNLPKILRGYGRTFCGYGEYKSAVVVVCDLNDKCLKALRDSLIHVLYQCPVRPNARFCIAVEEGEAWLLGDSEAIRSAFPKAKESILSAYVFDSVCGTWEKLADAVYPGGARKLSAGGFQAIGTEKSRWAREIAPLIDVESNRSPSFCYFRDKLRELAAIP